MDPGGAFTANREEDSTEIQLESIEKYGLLVLVNYADKFMCYFKDTPTGPKQAGGMQFNFAFDRFEINHKFPKVFALLLVV